MEASICACSAFRVHTASEEFERGNTGLWKQQINETCDQQRTVQPLKMLERSAYRFFRRSIPPCWTQPWLLPACAPANWRQHRIKWSTRFQYVVNSILRYFKLHVFFFSNLICLDMCTHLRHTDQSLASCTSRNSSSRCTVFFSILIMCSSDSFLHTFQGHTGWVQG